MEVVSVGLVVRLKWGVEGVVFYVFLSIVLVSEIDFPSRKALLQLFDDVECDLCVGFESDECVAE